MKPLLRLAIAAGVVALLVYTAAVDHYFRDEFYYLACTHHMAWGYVDQPPLSIAVLWIVRHVAGESLIVIRLAAALAFAAAVWTTGSIARRLGAGAFGEALAMVAMALAPEFLAAASIYSMNVLDVLLWTLAIRVFIDVLDSPSDGRWALLGLVLGLGLLNKISVLWLGAGIAAALVLTPARRTLLTRGPYIAAAIAGLLFLPHVLWQIANGWPTLEFIHNASSGKMLAQSPLAFVAGQVMTLSPVTLLVWGVGLVALLVHPRLRPHRALAIVYIVVAAIVVTNRTSRAEYLLPAYPMLFAAGAVMWEQWLTSRAIRGGMLAVMTVLEAATVPLALPILPVDSYVGYAARLGVAPSTEEKKDLGRLPQFFADRQGWNAMVDQVAAAWNSLTPQERPRAAVFTGNYGEAGAIDLLGRNRGLVALSGHNNFWIWGPMGHTGDVLIVLTNNEERLRQRFASVTLAGRTDCGDCMPYENHVGIWICRGMHPPLPDAWPALKHYE